MSATLADLLRVSLVVLRQRQRLEELERENALLRARLTVAHLKLQRRFQASADLPALLRPQAE